MTASACVTTAKGAAAIATIRLKGTGSSDVIRSIFKPAPGKEPAFEAGAILTGGIFDDDELIDHVVIGCLDENTFEIHCHGNPLIVEMIMKLLKTCGIKPVTIEEMLAKQFSTAPRTNTIEIEAKLTQPKAVTLKGVKIIANQPKTGLAAIANQWLNELDSSALENIKRSCDQILSRGKTAHLIINGAKVIIAGPPNTGKSTLLNCLCGREKAIVTDIAGTTRDWIGAHCRVRSLLLELIDTAGLDEELAIRDDIDTRAQAKTLELLTESDLVLLVLDGSKAEKKEKLNVKNKLQTPTKLLVVFNKSDLGRGLTEKQLDFNFAETVRISAKLCRRIDQLIEKIRHVLGVTDYNLSLPVYFTPRQQKLLEKLSAVKSKPKAKLLITELLNGELCV